MTFPSSLAHASRLRQKENTVPSRVCLVRWKGKHDMEEQDEKRLEPSKIAKMLLISLMQTGSPWHKASATAGLQISRSTAYRLLQAVRTRGEEALQDGRHGHPTKLREGILQWLVAACRAKILRNGSFLLYFSGCSTSYSSYFFITFKSLAYLVFSWGGWTRAALGFTRLHR